MKIKLSLVNICFNLLTYGFLGCAGSTGTGSPTVCITLVFTGFFAMVFICV